MPRGRLTILAVAAVVGIAAALGAGREAGGDARPANRTQSTYHIHTHTHDGSTHSHGHSHAHEGEASGEAGEAIAWTTRAPGEERDHHGRGVFGGHGSAHHVAASPPSKRSSETPPAAAAVLLQGAAPFGGAPSASLHSRPPPRAGPPAHLARLRTVMLLT